MGPRLWAQTPPSGGISDTLNHPPPTSGPDAYSPPYGAFMPNQSGFLTLGQSYVDPVFGTTIRRMSARYPETEPGFIYAKNGYWNADGTRYLAAFTQGGTFPKQIIDTTTLAVLRSGVPGNADLSFDPVNPDVYYYFNGSNLTQYSISSGASTVTKAFAGSLGSLGGSVDWIDNSGRYMVLSIGGVFRVWDKQTDTLFAGSISDSFGNGWIGMAPDGSGVLIANGSQGRWYPLDFTSQVLASSPSSTFAVSGDHADMVSASDGQTYLVVGREQGSFDTTVRFNVRTGAVQTLITYNNSFGAWCDGRHYSGVSRGSLRDWMLVDTETDSNYCGGADAITNPDPVASWWKFRQEIIMVNVLTGELRRLAHHRSRHTEQYCQQPRVNVNWDGTMVMFPSNFGVVVGGCGYSDLYSVAIPSIGGTPLPPSAPVNLRLQ